MPSETIARFPLNTFLENIAVGFQGNLFITSYEEGEVYQLAPDGAIAEIANVNGRAAGIVVEPQGNLLVAGATQSSPKLFFTNVNLDDFAVDQQGNLSGTTHVYKTVVRIATNGQIMTIATAEQGVAGSTALALFV